jgi:spoIIIJ-associated protein
MSKLKTKTQNPKSTNNKNIIEETTLELLKLMGEAKAKIAVSFDEPAFTINIQVDEPGFLIGNQGETLTALQLLLSLMVYKKTGAWQKLVIDVAGWLAQRKEALEKMALNTAQKVKFSEQEAIMPYFSSFERRIIHLALAKHPDVVTESIGEGKERRLVIKPKQQVH